MRGAGTAFTAIVAVAFGAAGSAVAAPKGQEAVSCAPIHTAAQLQAIGMSDGGSYCLANDIDASSISNFTPLVLSNGRFFGNGHVIRNLRIRNSGTDYVGLFGRIGHTIIQDVTLVNVDIVTSAKYVGGLVGDLGAAVSGNSISNVHVSGRVTCNAECLAGGIVGSMNGIITLTESSSGAVITGPAGADGYLGGISGFAGALSVVQRSYATGSITCRANGCVAGGLIAESHGHIEECGASGNVVALNGIAGGLLGQSLDASAVVLRSHASGAVSNTGTGASAGLIGLMNSGATLTESYSVGPVSGGLLRGGLVGGANMATITNSYWDTTTSGQAASGGGTGYTTAQLRAAVPPGFVKPTWGITKNHSYPFLDDAAIDFAGPLASIVRFNQVFTFPPVGQLEESNYAIKPVHKTAASLAAVYTSIAHGIGATRNHAAMRNATISSYWNDAAQVTTHKGPINVHVQFGPLVPIAPNVKLGNPNVVGQLKAQKLVILRGTYTKDGGGTAQHWMLATLYTATQGGTLDAVVANDPWTGQQVLIDPATKHVLAPGNFPLKDFTVDGYQTVTLLTPI